MDTNLLRDKADILLRALAGPDAILREDQWQAIEALVAHRRRALVVQRTGWGKSAVYFLATGLLREQGSGPTVIISPLLALMRNQIAAAARAGIKARTINSANPQEWDDTQAAIAAGAVDVLLVSPERLNNPDFRDSTLPKLTATAGLLVVDEAHCISDWGHDFRPDYRRLRTLLTELPAGVPVLATTATANNRVVTDIAEQLGVGATSDQDSVNRDTIGQDTVDGQGTLILRGPLERTSLHLSVAALPTAEARLAWLAENLAQLPGSGIIYTLTVAGAQDVAELLRGQGYEVASYTGKTDPTERAAAEDDLLANRVKALVATSALGMGFDKPDLGFVVHLGAPSSPIAYYQQVGRAGRGVERAEVILLPGREDQEIWRYFGSLAFPREELVQQVLNSLSAAGGSLSTIALEPLVDLSRSRLEMVLKVLDVDGAVHRVRGGWEATGQPWQYDADRYRRVAESRETEQRAMLEYQSTTGCRMEFLLRQLDDIDAKPCGRCDNCTGNHRATTVSVDVVQETKQQLSRPGIELSPRKLWPSGLSTLDVPLSGKIVSTEQAATGRTVGRLTDLGWGNQLRELLGASAIDGDVPESVFQACVQVLAAWDWPQRPVAVISIPSTTRPQVVTNLATRLAAVGRLSYLGEMETVGPASARANSAHRVASLWQRLTLPDTLREKLSTVDGPVLLVDDLVDTGWTMTLASKLLRQAGAPMVLPFALASTS